MDIVLLIGGILFLILSVFSGINHFSQREEMDGRTYTTDRMYNYIIPQENK
ncbi:MAG: hypothetical protein IIA61_14050 [Candidatus Marinimicrobia bacterium]|nr:hypothetical protein [Candidatus Neomarinimicrobiota bacterium]